MSKSNMLLGLAKGKVGDLVFYRDGGEQRTRTRVTPKNPRSIAQMTQRVKIANVSGIYRAAANILRDSFTNRPSNQSGFNAFSSGALALSPYLTSQQAKAGVTIPQPAMVSKGVMPSLEYRRVSDEDYAVMGLALMGAERNPTTIAGYSNTIMANYPSVVEGDELTFVTLKFTPDENLDLGVAIYNVAAIVGTFKIDSSDDTDPRTLGFIVSDDALGYRGTADLKDTDIVMQFVIHSHVAATGKLEVSTQYAHLSKVAQELYESFRSNEALLEAVESYRASATPILR